MQNMNSSKELNHSFMQNQFKVRESIETGVDRELLKALELKMTRGIKEIASGKNAQITNELKADLYFQVMDELSAKLDTGLASVILSLKSGFSQIIRE